MIKSCLNVVEWPSGQWQQTVNLPSYEFVGSNPTSTTISFQTRLNRRVFDFPKAQFPRGFAFWLCTVRVLVRANISHFFRFLSRLLTTMRKCRLRASALIYKAKCICVF